MTNEEKLSLHNSLKMIAWEPKFATFQLSPNRQWARMNVEWFFFNEKQKNKHLQQISYYYNLHMMFEERKNFYVYFGRLGVVREFQSKEEDMCDCQAKNSEYSGHHEVICASNEVDSKKA